MAQERRQRTRVDFSFDVSVLVDNQEIHVQGRNLSLKGMSCSPNKAFQKNHPCQVTLNLTPDAEGEPILAVMQGQIVRTTRKETAINFTLMDPDSFSHLKKLVEYHAQEPEKINHELMTSAFSPPPSNKN